MSRHVRGQTFGREPARRCSRCRRGVPADVDGWNGDFKDGRLIGYVCPLCQSPEENAEAAMNFALGVRQVKVGTHYRRGTVLVLTPEEALTSVAARCDAALRVMLTEVLAAGESRWVNLGLMAHEIAQDLPLEVRRSLPPDLDVLEMLTEIWHARSQQ